VRPSLARMRQIRQTGNKPIAKNFRGKPPVKLGKPLPNLVITNQVQLAIRDSRQATCKPCRTPDQRKFSI
jgi:hypothetical protein